MKYGVAFWCLDADGRRLSSPVWPKLQAFRYPPEGRKWWRWSNKGTRGWLVLEDYSVEFIFRGQHWRFTIRADFDFDGASIPRLAWSLIGDPLALDIQIAALVHDLLFCVHHRNFPLMTANSLFCAIQQASGASWAKRQITTGVVDGVGWTCWKKSPDDLDKYNALFNAERLPD